MSSTRFSTNSEPSDQSSPLAGPVDIKSNNDEEISQRLYYGAVNLIYVMIVIVAIAFIIAVSFTIGDMVSHQYQFWIGIFIIIPIVVLFLILNIKLEIEQRVVFYSIFITVLGIFITKTSQSYIEHLKAFY